MYGVNYSNNFNSYAAGDGYVNVQNMAGFSAMIEINYIDDSGNENDLTTDPISLFNSGQLTIPATATNISITVSMLDGVGNWVPVYNNVLSQSGIINLQLNGTIWTPNVQTIGETEATVNGVSIYNQGAFVAMYIVNYYFNGQQYSLTIPSFSVGMTRSIKLPGSASNLEVIVQVDTTGFGSWSTIYDQCFTSLNNLEATLSGVSFSAQINVDNNSFDAVIGVCENTTTVNSPVSGNNTPALVGGTGGNATTCSLPSAILSQYMSFMQQSHDEFVEILNKTMRN